MQPTDTQIRLMQFILSHGEGCVTREPEGDVLIVRKVYKDGAVLPFLEFETVSSYSEARDALGY